MSFRVDKFQGIDFRAKIHSRIMGFRGNPHESKSEVRGERGKSEA